ncbi:DUF3883 domain-containing protein, partial [candidate division KSB1 bacterium]|nr:DUF3883 domain-containing protein [candidate division KSB1 bacterium]
RLIGDGYDLQIEVQNHFYLVEIKGLRSDYGSVRFTQNEFEKAKENKNNYALIVISRLIDIPKMSVIFNPTKKIGFSKKIANIKQISYHSNAMRWEHYT